jgi:hypothetical protein
MNVTLELSVVNAPFFGANCDCASLVRVLMMARWLCSRFDVAPGALRVLVPRTD